MQLLLLALRALRLRDYMGFIAGTFLLIFALSGCAMIVPRSERSSTTSEWKKGNFHVRFQAGPRAQDGRTYSFYEITYTSVSQQEQELVMGSAHSTWPFVGSGIDSSPDEFIRVIADPNGKALLIEERIPNDCGPCSNYLWVHLDTNEFMQGTYLQLPYKVIGPPREFDYEFPKVRSLDDDILRYDYTVGATVTKRIDQIEKSNLPTPPG